jgi:hypothetical protein
VDETEETPPAPKTIQIVVVGDIYNFNFEGCDVDELPTKLRRAAVIIERQLGIRE